MSPPVFVAFAGDYDDRRVVGVYSTRDRAVRAALEAEPNERPDTVVVAQYTLDVTDRDSDPGVRPDPAAPIDSITEDDGEPQ
jgi:hypothetical protein